MHDHVGHVVELQQGTFDFRGVDLAAAHVDDVALAAEDAEPLAVDLHLVAGVEEPIPVERARRVQVAQHRGGAADPEPSVDDLCLVSLPADPDPEGVGAAGFRAEDA